MDGMFITILQGFTLSLERRQAGLCLFLTTQACPRKWATIEVTKFFGEVCDLHVHMELSGHISIFLAALPIISVGPLFYVTALLF